MEPAFAFRVVFSSREGRGPGTSWMRGSWSWDLGGGQVQELRNGQLLALSPALMRITCTHLVVFRSKKTKKKKQFPVILTCFCSQKVKGKDLFHKSKSKS